MMNRCLLLLATAFMLTSTALAHNYMQGDIHIIKPWSRPLPAVSPNGAAYMTLVNKGKTPDRLLSVSTPAARRAEIHAHMMEGGMMKMRPVDHVDIVPGEPSVLQPGGMHVMLMGLKEPLVEGKSFPLTLNFERAGAVEVTVIIAEPDGMRHEMKHGQKKEGG
jgi:copper(I)-binding protein